MLVGVSGVVKAGIGVVYRESFPLVGWVGDLAFGSHLALGLWAALLRAGLAL